MRPHGPGCRIARFSAVTSLGLLLAVAIPWRVSAQESETEFVIRSWDRKDGVPTTVLNEIQRTPDGYLWLATQRGLVRFDGERFKSISYEGHPELRTTRMNCVLAET